MTGKHKRARDAYHFRSVLLAAASLAALAPVAATAQDRGAEDTAEAADRDGPIIVTAQRREQSIIETPVAVSVASGEMLREKDITTAPDLIKVTPGLTAQLGANQSRRTSRFAIRGQGTLGTSGVTSYFAEVPDIGTPFYDLQNVQVLKGPQGTLFGRVTTGGAILFTPVMPGDEYEGYVNLKVGEYGRRDLEFAATAPLVKDVLSVRVAAQFLKSSGFSRNLYDGGRQDGRDGQSYRAIVKFTPTDWLTNTTIGLADYIEDPTRSGILTAARPLISNTSVPALGITLIRGNDQRVAPAVAQASGIACPAGVCPTWLALAQQAVAAQAARSPYLVNENNVNYPKPNMRQFGLINTTEIELTPDITLKNIFSHQNSRDRGPNSTNIDGWGMPMLEQANLGRPGSRGLTEEIQIQANLLDDRVEFTGGFFYEKNWTPYYVGASNIFYGGYIAQTNSAAGCSLLASSIPGVRTDPGNDGNFYCYVGAQNSIGKVRSNDKAVYGQATVHITDQLSVTGGYRYTWSSRSSTSLSAFSVSLPGLGIPTTTLAINGMAPFQVPIADIKSLPGEVWQNVRSKRGTYTLAAQYQFSPDFMLYATTRQGFNPGGRNSRFAPGFEFYGPEVVTDYEIGGKASWRSGPFRGLVSFDVYRSNYDDAQRSVTQPVNGVATIYLANVAKARIQGFDFDASVSYDWFTLGGFVTLTDGKYLRYPNTGQFADFQPPFDLTTFGLAGISKWLWGVRPTIDFGRMTGGPAISLSGNLYRRGTFFSSEPNLGPEINRTVPGNTQLDLRLDWRNIADTGLSAAVAMTNVTDFNGKVGGNELRATNGLNIDVVAPPRQLYVELNFKF
ncbi:MAG TPA: TonB-dependent receptor [Sphingopyxis sp.]|nr:TonB-dependent receptor [Sphingopyxis sp.]HMP46259.1 TonB-dependent receptor [Sphingopyxis sp.]HMQ18030.1 TonB-dependent receptor [Sphingopyxis sp.]